MTEKRFIGSSGGVYDQYKGDRFTWAEWDEILQLMNNLDEKARERSKALSKLQKKNEQLKHNYDVFVYRRMNDVNKISDLEKENKQLKKLLELISRAHSFTKEESVKEILRNEIKGIDTAAEYSAMAWNDYCILSNFFEKQYNEHWDNE